MTKNTHGLAGDHLSARTPPDATHGHTAAAVEVPTLCSVTVPSSWPARNAQGQIYEARGDA
jgi:hypothetical protein